MSKKPWSLLTILLIPLSSLLLIAADGHESFNPPIPIEENYPAAGGARLMEEPVPTEQTVRVTSDTKATAPSRSAPAGVAGGVVIVKDLPTSPPLGEPLRAHTQGEVVQYQALEEGEVYDWASPGSEDEVEIQIPAQLESAASDIVAAPAAPGGIVRQWTALSNTGWIPPDTVHAVGPKHIVEAVNSGFAIYTKLGTELQGYTTFDSFMHKPAGWQGFMFDPRVVYDWDHRKFVMLVLGRDDVNMRSFFWLAVSQTSDPTEGWRRYRFEATDTSGSSTAWLDYAGLGADRWGVYITGNFFYFTGGYRGSNLWSINPDIFDGGATNGWQWIDLTWPSGSGAASLQPAHPHSINSDGQTFFVNTFSGSGNKVLLWKLSGDRTASPTLTRAEIGTSTYNAIGMNIDQPDSDTDIDGFDARVMNAVYVNGRVFYTLTDDQDNDGSSSAWLTVKLNTESNAKEWEHTLWGGPGLYYFYPALTVQGGDRDGNVAVFGSWTDTDSTPGRYASGLYKIYTNQPIDGSGPFVGMVNGSAAYVALDSDGRNRWGDYSGAAYDWQCGHAWGAVESADTANRWRTTIGARMFGDEPPCPLVEVTAPNGGEVWRAGTTNTITWKKGGLGAGSEIFLYYHDGSVDVQIAGPLPAYRTSYDWVIPATPTSSAKVFVGSWTGSGYEAVDWSDDTFTITAPDLHVLNPSVSKASLLPGERFTAGATVYNQGNGSASATTLRYYVSADATISTSDTEVGSDPVAALAAGASSGEAASVVAPLALGTYWVGACVDPVMGESDMDNQCSVGIEIAVSMPDLDITALSAPPSANPGETINVSSTVKNQAVVPSGGFRMGLYFSADDVCTTSDIPLANWVVASLGPGASSYQTTPVTLPGEIFFGNYYLCAVADDLGEVAESNEANNTGSTAIALMAPLPAVNLKINGLDPDPPIVETPDRVILTLDITPTTFTRSLDWYWAILVMDYVFYVTPSGLSQTPAPFVSMPPEPMTDRLLFDTTFSPETWIFVVFAMDGTEVITYDYIAAEVTGSLVNE